MLYLFSKRLLIRQNKKMNIYRSNNMISSDFLACEDRRWLDVCERGHEDTIRLWSKKPDVTPDLIRHALIEAVRLDHYTTVRILLKEVSSLDTDDRSFYLTSALFYGNRSTFSELLNDPFKRFNPSINDNNLLRLAVEKRAYSFVVDLIEDKRAVPDVEMIMEATDPVHMGILLLLLSDGRVKLSLDQKDEIRSRLNLDQQQIINTLL